MAPGFAAKLNLLVDLVLVVGALLGSTKLMGHSLQPGNLDLWLLLGMAGLGWVVLGTVLGLYDPRFSDRAPLDDLALVSITVVSITGMLYLERLLIADGYPVVALSFFPLMLWVNVLGLRHFVFRWLAEREKPIDEALVIGVGAMGRLTGEELMSRGRRHVLGYLAFTNEQVTASLPQPLLGRVEQLEEILCRVPVDVVYIAGNVQKHGQEMQGAIKLCERFGIPFAVPAHSFRMDRARAEHGRAVADGYLHFVTHVPRPHQMAIKRLFDIASSSAGLIVLAPLLLTVALIIKLTSRGPIFFKQKRVGLHGKPFNMLKFRSMVVNAEELKAKLEALSEQTGPVFKFKNDPRITPIGRFIRKYSIDELPQLFNVLRGEMSVVGPRPPLPSEVEKYAAWQRRRLSVRPGVTYLWQVSGRNQISFEEWMYLDMQYIDNWSLLTEVDFIRKRVSLVLAADGGLPLPALFLSSDSASSGGEPHLPSGTHRTDQVVPRPFPDRRTTHPVSHEVFSEGLHSDEKEDAKHAAILAARFKAVLLDLHPDHDTELNSSPQSYHVPKPVSGHYDQRHVPPDVQILATRFKTVLLSLYPNPKKGAGNAGN